MLPKFASKQFADSLGLVAVDIDQLREALPPVVPGTKVVTFAIWRSLNNPLCWCLRYFVSDNPTVADYGECLVFESRAQAEQTIEILKPKHRLFASSRERSYKAWMEELIERAKEAQKPVQPRLWR